jgi:hypothetical protein
MIDGQLARFVAQRSEVLGWQWHGSFSRQVASIYSDFGKVSEPGKSNKACLFSRRWFVPKWTQADSAEPT